MTVTREYPDVKDVTVSLDSGVLSVTLNRPDSLNSLTQDMLVAIADAMDLAAANIGRIRAMRLALLADRLTATDAFDWGLISAVYPADEFDAAVDKIIAKLRSGPAVALRETKQAVNAATLTELEGAFARE